MLKENYTDTPDGIPGNDDCGEMSSWAVMSMMGFYPVDPTSLAYELTSPVFPKVVIHLVAPYPGKTFTIESSPDPEHMPYIQAVELDGKPHSRNWIALEKITAGGAARFTLGAEPNKSWGAEPEDAPPSLSDEKP